MWTWRAHRLLARVRYDVPSSDPVAIGAAFAALTMSGVLAGYLPARRATLVDPVRTLRADG